MSSLYRGLTLYIQWSEDSLLSDLPLVVWYQKTSLTEHYIPNETILWLIQHNNCYTLLRCFQLKDSWYWNQSYPYKPIIYLDKYYNTLKHFLNYDLLFKLILLVFIAGIKKCCSFFNGVIQIYTWVWFIVFKTILHIYFTVEGTCFKYVFSIVFLVKQVFWNYYT